MLLRTVPTRSRAAGVVYVLALLLLAVFSSVALAFVSMSDLSVQKAENCREMQAARMAAESGLEFAMMNMANIVSEGMWEGTPDMIGLSAAALSDSLNGTSNIADASVSCNAAAGVIAVPSIVLPNGNHFSFTVTRVDANTLRLTVTGQAQDVLRSLAIDYTVQEDTSVMSYAVASRPRLIARGNIQIDGDLCSMWTRTDAAPPFDIELGDDGYVADGVKTILSEEEFEEANGLDYLDEELHDQLSYDEPAIAEYTTADFDTSSILNSMAGSGNKNTLPSSGTTSSERFPDTWTGTRFDRPVYANQTLDWTYIPKNTHARFTNCTFTGITYVDTDGTTKTSGNNIVFEDCTFEGPVVTDVPSSFAWQYNSLNFEGNTTFKANEIAPYLDGCTLLAPNFNINIGDFHKEGASSDSKITGILVGGIVDLRDDAVVEGTIMSMANLDHISYPYKYGTNLGYWEEDAEEYGGTVPMTRNIRITPTPDATLPMGIRKRYTVTPKADSYMEVR